MVGDLLECAYTQTFYLSHAATRGVTQLIDRIGDSNGERGIYVYGHSEGTLIANRGVSDVSDNTSYKRQFTYAISPLQPIRVPTGIYDYKSISSINDPVATVAGLGMGPGESIPTRVII